MKIRQPPNPHQLNLLCIGQPNSCKTLFLTTLTTPPSPHSSLSSPNSSPLPLESPTLQKTIYKIYTKILHKIPVYFHQLSEKEELYLEQEFDGVLYFVDFVQGWYSGDGVLKWMEFYEEVGRRRNGADGGGGVGTGRAIGDVPVLVVVTKVCWGVGMDRWRRKLIKQLSKVVEPQQIFFYQSTNKAQQQISKFCSQILQKKANGIKKSLKNYWKIFGIEETLRMFFMNLQYFFVFPGGNTGIFVDDRREDDDEDKDEVEVNKEEIRRNQQETKEQLPDKAIKQN